MTDVAVGVNAFEPLGSSLEVRFAVMRARRDCCESFGSLFVLMERALPSTAGGVLFVPSEFACAAGGWPLAGSSVWMKQQRFP